jgi:hypothetical protein
MGRIYCVVTGVLLVAVVCASSAHAESGTFGIEAGIAASTIIPAGTGESIATRPGAVVGFYAVIPILKSLSFVPEIVYVQKHSRRTVGATATDLRLDYVELPLLAKMPLFWGVYITEGVSLGFPVEMHGLAPNLVNTTSPDVAIVLGGGYDVARKIAVEFRYDGGLRRVNTIPEAPVQRTRAYMAIAKLHF